MNTASTSLLRFLAAVIVILFHNRNNGALLFSAVPKILIAGPQMVTFFFVLSGFGLVLAYRGRAAFSLKSYWVKRMGRIAPASLAALLIIVATAIRAGVKIDPIALLLHLSFLQSWFPPYPLTLNTPAWFVSDLVFMYAAFPWILSFIRNSAPNPKRFLYFALALWAGTQALLTGLLNSSFYRGYPSVSHDLIYYFPPVHFCSFLFGAATAFYITRDNASRPMSRYSPILMAFALVTVVTLIETEDSLAALTGLNLPFCASLYAPPFAVLVAACYLFDNAAAGGVLSRWCAFLGEISFPMYILQHPVANLPFRFLKGRGHSPDFRFATYLLLLTTIGIVFVYGVDRPFRAWLSRRSASTS